MQSLFVLLRITIFEKGFPSLLPPTKTLFSAKYHMYQNEKFTTSPDAQPMTKFHICPKTKSTPLPAKPAEHPYPARLNRKFRHPASPAKGFRILPRPSRFPYSAPAQNFRIAKKHLHPLRMEVFRLFKLPITQQQKYLLQLCIRPCVPTGCVFP